MALPIAPPIYPPPRIYNVIKPAIPQPEISFSTQYSYAIIPPAVAPTTAPIPNPTQNPIATLSEGFG